MGAGGGSSLRRSTITTFPDPTVPPKVVLDYTQAKTLIMSGQQLIALAQSSSIVLTTITDISGFMSFLGLATIFSSLLT